jgi:putative endonuclease
VNTKEEGNEGEALALEHLQRKGFKLVMRNYRYGRGEIDIIMMDKECLVFVEVKARKSTEYGEPEEAVTKSKRGQLRYVAKGYLFEMKIEDVQCRFDVIAIVYKEGEPVIRHIENAF